MRFTLSFDMSNDAFVDPDGKPGQVDINEVSAVLRRASYMTERDGLAYGLSAGSRGHLFDTYGNRVGHWEVTES
jgi:hypothetical protein